MDSKPIARPLPVGWAHFPDSRKKCWNFVIRATSCPLPRAISQDQWPDTIFLHPRIDVRIEWHVSLRVFSVVTRAPRHILVRKFIGWGGQMWLMHRVRGFLMIVSHAMLHPWDL